jgi:hypothetical protein
MMILQKFSVFAGASCWVSSVAYGVPQTAWELRLKGFIVAVFT